MKRSTVLIALSLILGLWTVVGLVYLLGSPTPSRAASLDRSVLTVWLQGSSSTTRYVSVNGSDQGDCSSPGSPCRTLQYAVDRAGPGDLILVTGGVFTGSAGASQVVFVDKNLTFRGGCSSDFTTRNPEAWPTVVDGERVRRGFTISGQGSQRPVVSIDGFHIRNGYGNGQGGGLRVSDAEVTLSGVQVYQNVASSSNRWSYCTLKN